MRRAGPSLQCETRRPVRWKRGAVYAALSVALFFLLLEGTLRLSGFRFAPGPIRVQVGGEQFARALRDASPRRNLPAYQPEGRYEDSASLIWRPVAGVAPFNSQGLLGPELPRERSDRLRIACLGDSCTQLGTPRYCDVLRDLLSEHYGREVEVLNAGVIGYSTYQGLRRLEQVLPYRPDIVTIYFGWNDHWSIYTAPDPQLARDRRQSSFAWVDYVGWSRVVQAALWAAVEMRRATGAEAQPPAERLVCRVPLADYRSNLRELIAVCRAHDAVPVLVTAPTTMVRGATPPGLESAMAGEAGRLYESLPALHAAYVSATREVAHETETALVDAYAEFGEGRGLIERDHVHLRPEGARRMAELLAQAVTAIVQADPELARRAGVQPRAAPGDRRDGSVSLTQPAPPQPSE